MIEEYWRKEIDKITEKFIDSFGSLTEPQLNFKPHQEKWSIAQNISHLILLNNSYFKYFDEIKNDKHILPPTDAMEQLAKSSLQTLQPYTSEHKPKSANTWNMWQPSQENYGFGILKDFTNHQSGFKTHIKTLHEFFQHPTFIKYPGLAELVFRLDDCIEFLLEHENRHWIQANEIKKLL